jgi:hypothetical protein
MICADFARATWLVFSALLENSVFVGVSENSQVAPPFDEILGYPVYDGPSVVRKVQFLNFQSKQGPKAYAIDIFGGAMTSTKNSVSGLTFKNPDALMIKPPTDPDVMAQVVDMDGSVTGIKGGQIIMPVIGDKGSVAMDPLRDSGTCKLNGNAYFCGPESTASWVLLDKFRQTPTGAAIKIGLPAITVAMTRGQKASGSRIVNPRKKFQHQYELSLMPNAMYTFTPAAPWTCFTIQFYSGIMGEKYFVRFSGMPASKKVQGASRVTSVEALQSATKTSDFHDGKDLHVVAVISNQVELLGYTLDTVGQSGTLDICDVSTDGTPSLPGPSSAPSSGANPSSAPSSGVKPSSAPSSGVKPSSAPSSGAKPSSAPRSGANPSAAPSSGVKPSSAPRSGANPSLSINSVGSTKNNKEGGDAARQPQKSTTQQKSAAGPPRAPKA